MSRCDVICIDPKRLRDMCVTRDQSRKAYRAVAEQKQAITIQNWEKIITDNKVFYHKN